MNINFAPTSSRSKRMAATGWFLLVAVLVYLWSMQIAPGYFARNFLASAHADLQHPPLNISFRGNVAGMKPFVAMLHLVTDIPLANLPYLPLGAFLRAMLYYAIIRSMTGNRLAGIALAIMTAVYPWAGWGYSSVFVHSLGAPLFLTAALVAYAIARNGMQWQFFVMGDIILLGTHLLDYTTEVWTIVMFGALGVFWLVGLNRPNITPTRPSVFFLLSIFGLVLFATKNTAATFFGMLVTLDPTAAVSKYFSPTSPPTFPYQYQPSGTGIGMSLPYYLTVVAVLGVYGIVLLVQTVKARRIRLSQQEIVVGGMAVGGGGATLLYTLMGRFSQFFIFVAGPLLTVLCASFFASRVSIPFRRSHLTTGVAVILLVLAGAESGALIAAGDFSSGSDAAVEPGGEWLVSHASTSAPTVLAGLDSQGRMRMAEARSEIAVNWSIYTPKRYSRLVEGRSVQSEYVAIDYRLNSGTQGMNNWQIFDNLRTHRAAVESNTHLDTVYTSGGFVILSTSKRENPRF